jgi:hypothetical protein
MLGAVATVTAATQHGGGSLADWALVATTIVAALIAALVPLSAYLRRPRLSPESGARNDYSFVEGRVEAYLPERRDNRVRDAGRPVVDRVQAERFAPGCFQGRMVMRLVDPLPPWSGRQDAPNHDRA